MVSGVTLTLHCIKLLCSLHQSDRSFSSSIYWQTNDSRNFGNVGIKEIGHRSEVIFLENFIVGTGITFTCFHRTGSWPSLTGALKIAQMGSAMKGAMSFNI